MAIKDSGERTQFETGAVRDMHQGKGRMDLLPWEALIEVSKHCEEGAAKHGERNCEKGIPIHSLIDSGFRHLAKYMMGMDDEPHLRAAAWNILFALYMEIKHPEMQDIPTRAGEWPAVNEENWHSDHPKGCDTCKFHDKGSFERPCSKCIHNAVEYYTPKEMDIDTLNCENCKYFLIPTMECPCYKCSKNGEGETCYYEERVNKQ